MALSQHPALLTARRCSGVPRVSVLLHASRTNTVSSFPFILCRAAPRYAHCSSVPYCFHLVDKYFTVQQSFKSRMRPRVSAPNESLKICICDSRLSQIDESNSGRMLDLVLEKRPYLVTAHVQAAWRRCRRPRCFTPGLAGLQC